MGNGCFKVPHFYPVNKLPVTTVAFWPGLMLPEERYYLKLFLHFFIEGALWLCFPFSRHCIQKFMKIDFAILITITLFDPIFQTFFINVITKGFIDKA